MLFQKQIEKLYRSNLFVRNDNPHGIFYFGPEDFPGLQAHAYIFTAKAGHELKGWFYHYEDPLPGRLVRVLAVMVIVSKVARRQAMNV